jgi:L-fuculose-phosphate aldolase
MANVDCRAENLVGVDLEGNVVRGEGQPSKDVGFHLGIYRARPDVEGIVHAHAPWAISLGLLGYRALPLLTPHARNLRQVPVVAYADSGSEELDQRVIRVFASSDTAAVLLARHGLVTVGPSLERAGAVAEMVEETAQIAVLVHLGGGEKIGWA